MFVANGAPPRAGVICGEMLKGMVRLLRSRSVVAAAIAAALVVATVALTAGAATAPDLTPVPADRLIASSIDAVADRSLSVSGTGRTHVDLGIPQLPTGVSSPSGPLSLLLSDQTFKVWRSPDGVRTAQMLPAAERDVIVTPSALWLWDSDRFTAWHADLSALGIGTATPSAPPSLGDLETMVSKLLARIEPYASVTTASPVEVAGRPAYVVQLTPVSSSNTLVHRIEVAVDAQTRLPLRLEVFAKDVSAPVVSAGYTAVSFAEVDPSVFDFTRPNGATVHELGEGGDENAVNDGGQLANGGISDVRTFGESFDLVFAARVADVPKELAPFFPYRGAIASADVVDRGDHRWIVAGLVPPDALERVEHKLT
jgi:outer membrane lipoprotein-sorting protein